MSKLLFNEWLRKVELALGGKPSVDYAYIVQAYYAELSPDEAADWFSRAAPKGKPIKQWVCGFLKESK